MALEKVRDILKAAQQANTAVIAFDALDCNTISACIRGAERARRPVIVMLYPNMRSMMPFAAFAQAVKSMARSASVPVGLHLDHCSDSSSYGSASSGGDIDEQIRVDIKRNDAVSWTGTSDATFCAGIL